MRTIIEIPTEQLTALDAWREARGLSRAEAIRQAIGQLLDTDRARADRLNAAFGLWRERPVDGLTEQNRLRDEWASK